MKRQIGKPCGRKLDFALAVLSAIRAKHGVTHPMTCREIAEITQAIVGSRGGCTRQNISRIELIALRKVRLKLSESGLKAEVYPD